MSDGKTVSDGAIRFFQFFDHANTRRKAGLRTHGPVTLLRWHDNCCSFLAVYMEPHFDANQRHRSYRNAIVKLLKKEA
jgi:hypothetical protein